MQVLVRSDADVVLARQRAQAIAELAEFDVMKQTSFATAISEIGRNAVQFAGEARVSFVVESFGKLHFLVASVADQGPGIAAIRERGGHWDRSTLFEGQGINSARKLVKLFSINCPAGGGTIVKLGLRFPDGFMVRPDLIHSWAARLAELRPRNLLEEMHHRNQELLAALAELQRKDVELQRQIASDAVLKEALAESTRLLEARVEERTKSLSLSNEELRAFSYTVSHDLRAPLRAINGFTHLLLEEHVRADNADARDSAARILHAVDQMDQLIQDLVAYTQVNKLPTPLKEVDPEALIEDLVEQSKGRLKSGETIEICGDFPNITANSAILHSALQHLFENALKFTNGSGKAFIRFRGVADKEKLRLWVEDNGIGIAPQHHDRIFGVFERLHGKEIPGRGIGLALVKRWVAGMQGAVGVESSIGAGARFWIDLPLSKSAVEVPSEPPRSSPEPSFSD